MTSKVPARDYLDMYVNMCIVVKHARESNQITAGEIATVEGFRDTMRDVIVKKMEFAGDDDLPPYDGWVGGELK